MVGFPYAHKSGVFALKHGAASRNTLSGVARLQHLQNWEKNQVRPEVVLVNHFKSKDELAAEAIASALDVAANDLSGVVRVSTQRTARSCYQTDTVRFVLLASKTACEILSVLSPIAPSISKVDPVVIDSKKCRFSRTYD